jgi:Leucine-rich repeat (LRR) protein
MSVLPFSGGLLLSLLTLAAVADEPGKDAADKPASEPDAKNNGPPPLPELKVGVPVLLFDGKTLAGWTMEDGKPVAGGWIVEDGAICRENRGGNIFYEREVGDFELTFEWKIVANGNSGLKYRVRKYGSQSLGCEYQMLGEKGQSLSKGSCGALYALYEPNEKKKLNPIGEWNTAKIVVHGPVIEHWMNGEKIVEADLAGEEWRNRLAQSKFAPHADFARNTTGRIMLTDHGSKAWFRNLVLTPLPNREIPPLPEAAAPPAGPQPPHEPAKPGDDAEAKARAYFKSMRRDVSGGEYLLYFADATDELLAHLGNLRSLKTLHIGDFGLGNHADAEADPFAFLARLVNLRVLTITSVPLADESLAHVASLNNLEKLSLAHVRVTDEGLRHLRKLHQLKSLSLVEIHAAGRGLAHLGDLDRLESLTLYGDSFTDQALSHLPAWDGLQRLDISRTSVTDEGLAPLADCRQLNSLNLSHNAGVDGSGLRPLAGKVDLESLTLAGGEIDDAGFAAAAGFPGLTKLDFYSSKVTDNGLAALAPLERLQNLYPGYLATDEGLARLRHLSRLERLTLRGKSIDGSGFKHLAPLKNLKSLDLYALPLDENQLVHLAALPNLEDLNLMATPVGDAAMLHVKKLPRLRNLNLHWTRVSDEGLAHLESVKTLERLDAIESRVSSAGEARLKRALPHLGIAVDAPP